MIRKKLAVSLLACALLFTGGSAISAAAASQTTELPYCTIEDCNVMKNHWHDGFYYCGHSLDDGCDYHVACDVEGCNRTREHTHDGVTYLGHCNTDGHSWHSTGHHRSGRGCHRSGRGCH